MKIFLDSMRTDLQLFIRQNFNGFSYDGSNLMSLDRFFNKCMVNTKEIWFHKITYSIVNNEVKSREDAVRFFNFEDEPKSFHQAIVYKRLLSKCENTYDVKGLIDICINAKLLSPDVTLDCHAMQKLLSQNHSDSIYTIFKNI